MVAAAAHSWLPEQGLQAAMWTLLHAAGQLEATNLTLFLATMMDWISHLNHGRHWASSAGP
jgi:hypothetical protein